MLSPVDDDEDEDVRAAVTRTFLVLLKAVKEEEGANASVVAATTVSVRAARARRSRIMARARSLEILRVVQGEVLPSPDDTPPKEARSRNARSDEAAARMTHITSTYVQLLAKRECYKAVASHRSPLFDRHAATPR